MRGTRPTGALRADCTHSFPDPHPQPIEQIGNCRDCGISYQEAKAAMSIYASIEGIGDHGDPEHLGKPWVYRGSHLTPSETDSREGSIGLALIPSHITADGRDDQPSDGPPWPWLRLSLQDVPSDDPCVLLDPAQARFLAEQLRTWADRADPPEFEGGQHWWIHDTRGIGWPGSHDRDAVVARLAELREQHPTTEYRLVCDTTISTVENT